MNRRDFLKKTSAATATSIVAGAVNEAKARKKTPDRPTKDGKPHIILIMTDQQRADTVGFYGNKAAITPNMDQIAKEGVAFDVAYSSVPSCTPARAGLLTGMSPWGHGMLGYRNQATKYKFEKPRMLNEAGYHTVMVGKNHFHPAFNTHGYKEMHLEDGLVRVLDDYSKWFLDKARKNKFLANAIGMDPEKEYTQKELSVFGSKAKLCAGMGFNDNNGEPFVLAEEYHPTEWTGQTAVDCIKNYDKEEPMFMKLSFHRPHSPFDPPQRCVDMYDGVDIPEPFIGDWADKYKDMGNLENPSTPLGHFPDDYVARSRKHYYASVTFVDEWVGKVTDALKAKGMYDNCLIIFTSDHGDMMGDHYHWRKCYAYEGSAKVPMLMKWPEKLKVKAKKGQTLKHPVELRDILPTCLDVAGAEIPAEMEGTSMLRTVRERNPEWREYIDLEHSKIYFDENDWYALTDGKHKYIFFGLTGRELLFDLEKDPNELKDLASKPEHKAELERWRDRMTEHLSIRGDKFVDGNRPRVKPKAINTSPNFPWT
ncbi:choline-sulfatase [Fulvitalea axinellae]|uniref:Choline-sulfatase n=1 Tax=Fulvitalea axinellae TaxID=1182444 RepID=A0AAU9CTQ1_9BACT|nr:choline-sulfatase [Fulvitalea axinellae]